MNVHHAGSEGDLTMPFFRMSEIADDDAAVVVEEAGHFCLSYIEYQEKNLLPIVYDTNKVFGEDTSLLRPMGLYEKSIKEILEAKQYGAARTSSAFAAVDDVTIWPGQEITITSFYGRADSITDLPNIARRITQGGFAQFKLSRARALIQQITSGAETVTADHLFDKHVEQMFLDNSLMGGIPVLLGDVDDDGRNADDDEKIKVYHLFSRRGDLERDYDNFIIENTYFSEGPSNFRDVIQNRRNDVIFNPRVGAFNFNMFLSLIQADGYNPLSVEAVVFSIDDPEVCLRLATNVVGFADGHRAQREALASILCDGEFRPGQLVEMIEEQSIFLMTSLSSLIDDVAAASKVSPAAVTEGAGFAADHWTYLMDLLSSYLQIYPDREEYLLFSNKLTYYYSHRVVSPRKSKYVLSKSYNGEWLHVRQLDATYESTERVEYMRQYVNPASGWYKNEASIQHDVEGNIFRSSAIEKLFLLATSNFLLEILLEWALSTKQENQVGIQLLTESAVC
ncbi:hypothetical protein QTG54_009750 [Skeletonema marinoi]|uniref:Uncharacterized protein n=1 Tax=Skeletonema marinoi TaxID=267567 RepID=A0AAD8Y544_9STRA|nr:hypothetical protein QTG54_009750 [Skeletonema marinoi]